MLCAIAYLLLIPGWLLVPSAVMAVLSLGVAIFAAICVSRLAACLHTWSIGLGLGIVTLVPFIGLIAPLAVNLNAARVLRKCGMDVWLLANPKEAWLLDDDGSD